MKPAQTDQDPLSGRVIGAAIEVHRALGPGLLESAYQASLEAEMEHLRISYQSQVGLPVTYRDRTLDCGYRLDLVIENRLIIEIKAVATLEPIHEAQILTYLRLSNLHTGLLINFNTPILHRGIKRFSL